MTCLFKVNLNKTLVLDKIAKLLKTKEKNYYFSHSIVTNLRTGETKKDVYPIVNVSKDSFKRKLLFYNYSPLFQYYNFEIKENALHNYNLKTKILDLNLVSKKQPLLEQNTGILKFDKYYSYYYSLTNLETKGLLNWNNNWLEVKGKSWHDHQWMSNLYNKEEWDWFSIQLENNTEIICTRIKQKNSKEWYKFATRIDNLGKTTTTHNVEFIPTSSWTNKKVKYDVNWIIKFPEWDEEIYAKAIKRNQEMNVGFMKYWEGPLTYETKNGLNGKGFGEFVGRSFAFDVKAIIKSIKSEFSNKKN